MPRPGGRGRGGRRAYDWTQHLPAGWNELDRAGREAARTEARAVKQAADAKLLEKMGAAGRVASEATTPM
jgi:hypothetical protein